MAIGDIFRLQVVVRKTSAGRSIVNSTAFRQEDVLVLDTPEEDLAQAWMIECSALLPNLFTNQMAITELRVAQSPDFFTSFVLDVDDIGGALSGDPLPFQNAPEIALKTSLLSRRGRGRIYLPPANEAANSEGAPATSYIEDLQQYADALLIAMNTTTIDHSAWALGVWSKRLNAFNEATQASARGYWASQRNRRKIA